MKLFIMTFLWTFVPVD